VKETEAKKRGDEREADPIPLRSTLLSVEVLVQNPITQTNERSASFFPLKLIKLELDSPLISSIERPSTLPSEHHLPQPFERSLRRLENHDSRVEAVRPSSIRSGGEPVCERETKTSEVRKEDRRDRKRTRRRETNG